VVERNEKEGELMHEVGRCPTKLWLWWMAVFGLMSTIFPLPNSGLSVISDFIYEHEEFPWFLFLFSNFLI
jgi:hypothetical protein